MDLTFLIVIFVQDTNEKYLSLFIFQLLFKLIFLIYDLFNCFLILFIIKF